VGDVLIRLGEYATVVVGLIRELVNSRARTDSPPPGWEEVDTVMTSEAETHANESIRPIRVVRETEVLRIPRPADSLDDNVLDEQHDLITAPALT
jgi:hypothetical protein